MRRTLTLSLSKGEGRRSVPHGSTGSTMREGGACRRVKVDASSADMGAWVYILRCSDGSYYVGSTRWEDPGRRLSEHELGVSATAYTASRRPVRIVFAEYFERIVEAVALERQIKGWSRAKKEALMARDFDLLKSLSRNRQDTSPSGSTGS